MKSQQITPRASLTRLTILIAAAILALSLAGPVRAQSRTQKIGVVDIDRIMQRSVSFQSAARRIESELSPLRDRYNAKLTQRDNLRQSLRDKRSALKPEEVTQQEEAYLKIADEVNDINYSVEKETSRLQREILEPVMKRLKSVIEGVAKRDGYDLVLYANQVFYFAESADLTDQVMRSLDSAGGEPALPSLSKASKSDDDESDKSSASSKKSSKSSRSRK